MAANEAARTEKFVIPTNMRVPEKSVIFRLFGDPAARDGSGREDTDRWADSGGKRQPGRAVAVEARRQSGRVVAIVQPVEPVRPKLGRQESNSLFGE